MLLAPVALLLGTAQGLVTRDSDAEGGYVPSLAELSLQDARNLKLPPRNRPDRSANGDKRAAVIRNNLSRERERLMDNFPKPGDPHNCLTRERWAPAKAAWCCEHHQLGCAPTTPSPTEAPAQPDPTPPALDAAFYLDYRDYEDYVARLEAIREAYPAVVQLSVIGRSHEGRDIRAIQVSGKQHQQSAAAEPRTVVVTCMLHAREWLTAPTCVFLAERLAMAAADGENFGGVTVKLAPVVNPDGYIYSRSTHNMQRKNMHRLASQHDTTIGVDLNRNFETGYGTEDPTNPWNGGYGSDDPHSDVYIGPEAGSEAETKAVKTMFEDQEVHIHLDIHSYSALVLPMWSYNSREAGDFPANLGGKSGSFARAHNVGRELTGWINACHAKPRAEYVFQEVGGEELYNAGGTVPDWTTSQGAFGYTVELVPDGWSSCQGPTGGTCFQPWPGARPGAPASQQNLLLKTANEVLAGLERLIGALANGETGLGPWKGLGWSRADCGSWDD